MNWSVEYYPRQLPLISIDDSVMLWDDLPNTNVVSVTVEREGTRMKMSGMDGYWIEGDCFGAYTYTGPKGWYNTSYRYLAGFESTRYKGSRRYAYQWPEDGRMRRIEMKPSRNTHVIHGIMMPDDEARIAGVL